MLFFKNERCKQIEIVDNNCEGFVKNIVLFRFVL